jgi:hypothetical protein
MQGVALMVIDCHTHLSTFGHEGQPFGDVVGELLSSMRECGIAHSVVLPDSESGTCVSDLATTVELARAHSELSVLGTACIPALTAGVAAELDALASAGAIVGMKLYPGFEEFFPTDDGCLPIYEICLRHDLPVLFHSGETMGEPWREQYSHPTCIASLAERLPDLNIMVAHFAQPHILDCRDLLLTHSNVHADISGLAHPSVVKRCGAGAIRDVLLAVAAKAPAQLLFGTDWPICSVQDHIALVESLPIPSAEKAMVLSGNALRLFPLKLS